MIAKSTCRDSIGEGAVRRWLPRSGPFFALVFTYTDKHDLAPRGSLEGWRGTLNIRSMRMLLLLEGDSFFFFFLIESVWCFSSLLLATKLYVNIHELWVFSFEVTSYNFLVLSVSDSIITRFVSLFLCSILINPTKLSKGDTVPEFCPCRREDIFLSLYEPGGKTCPNRNFILWWIKWWYIEYNSHLNRGGSFGVRIIH